MSGEESKESGCSTRKRKHENNRSTPPEKLAKRSEAESKSLSSNSLSSPSDAKASASKSSTIENRNLSPTKENGKALDSSSQALTPPKPEPNSDKPEAANPDEQKCELETDKGLPHDDITEEQCASSSSLKEYNWALYGCRSVDNYQRLNRIQEGTYGVVYRAQDKQTGQIVALKKVKMAREKNGFPLTSLRETTILMAHRHPNIVGVKEIVVGSSNLNNIFIVMEFLDHDLKDLMEDMKAPFLASEVKCLMKQLLQGMEFLHDNWILHRDLKTSNLLLSNRGILKIADFGLAREYGSPLKPYTFEVVTEWYRCIELLLGARVYSTAVDMWSVGCIFAELISKKPLFPGRSQIDMIDKIFKLLGLPNETIWPGYSDLPEVKRTNFKGPKYNNLRNMFPFITDAAVQLLNSFLTYDPSRRISASAALDHPYFKEVPPPKDPEMMPTWPSKAQGERRHRSPVDEVEKLRQGSGLLTGDTYQSSFRLK